MFLKQLNLTNFRNYSGLELKFDHRPTIFLGDNAAGKSSILESVYLLSTTRSLRAENEDEFIKDKEPFARIEGFVEEGNGETELLIIVNRQSEKDISFRKKVMVNGVSRRSVDFIGNLPSVIFHPSDINMVTGSPSLRRWHIDLTLAQIDSDYKRALTLYEQFLTSRNRVLKRIREGEAKIDELIYWTEGLLLHGKVVSEKRQKFFDFINNLEKVLGEFSFEYNPSLQTEERLAQTNGREIAAAATLIGPHRDDFTMLLEGKNIGHFGSRGEQRTATLSFKLAILEYMAKILGKRPILLLDDVFSELDGNHRAHVADIVSKQQTLIATVELENIPKEFLDKARILKVKEGSILF